MMPIAALLQVVQVPDIPPVPPVPDIVVHTGVPGAEMGMPVGAVYVSIAFFAMIVIIAIGIPLVRALARKWDRQANQPQVPADFTARLERIEQAVEAVAVEVERISEGQRFTTKLLSEMRALPAPNPLAQAQVDRLAQPQREPVK